MNQVVFSSFVFCGFFSLLAVEITSWYKVQSVSMRTVVFRCVLMLCSRTLEVEEKNN